MSTTCLTIHDLRLLLETEKVFLETEEVQPSPIEPISNGAWQQHKILGVPPVQTSKNEEDQNLEEDTLPSSSRDKRRDSGACA